MSPIVLTANRHFLTQKHVVWAIKRENRFSGSTWARFRKKGQDRTRQDSQKKSQSGNSSPIWKEASTVLIETKICMVGSLPDVFTYTKFQDDILVATILQGVEFLISYWFFAWALQQSSANALPAIQNSLKHLKIRQPSTVCMVGFFVSAPSVVIVAVHRAQCKNF